MFYSEALLSKTGPLARVWLSANLERRLSKTHILQSNIETSVGAIVGQDQAPMALRLSGQLLLGVVRIYSRKARYLLEDCNEALMKIKMAFRPGNVDLPTTNTTHSAAQLTLPDVITELDLLLPDPSSLLADLGDLNLDGGAANISRRRDIMIDDSSSFLQDSVETGRGHKGSELGFDMNDDVLQLEDDLELDIGEPSFVEDRRPARTTIKEHSYLEDDEESIEMGRDRPPSRGMSEDFTRDDLQLDLDIEMGGLTPRAKPKEDMLRIEDDLNIMGDEDDFGAGAQPDWQAGIGEEISELNVEPPNADVTATSLGLSNLPGLRSPNHDDREDRASMSPLSSVRSSVERELEAELRHGSFLDRSFAEDPARPASEDPEHQDGAHTRQVRKRKVVVDDVTEIRAKQIKSQQEDRSKILREPSFLPRDPGVLALVTLQRTGGFATSVFYPKNIHPDLAGMLSPEFVKRMAAMKRKREEGLAADEEPAEGTRAGDRESPAKRIQLELGNDSLLDLDANADTSFGGREKSHEEDEHGDDGEMIDFPQGTDFGHLDNGIGNTTLGNDSIISRKSLSPAAAAAPQAEDQDFFAPEDDLLNAADIPPPPPGTGPISEQTIHAVHLLRSEFTSANTGSTPRGKASQTRKFQDLLPPPSTNRVDATKMFFEVLVLATKDAVKVRQETVGGTQSTFGGDIVIMPKKGLWGKWAEERDEQQVAEEEEAREEKRVRESDAAQSKGKMREGGEGVRGRVVNMEIRRGGIAAA
ncbi:Rec8 like protein-domain-containing protein [Peziza echinospora]|nr:Rec8 like protein-domain-containing protein [Peziza echinospora]